MPSESVNAQCHTTEWRKVRIIITGFTFSNFLKSFEETEMFCFSTDVLITFSPSVQIKMQYIF